MRMPGGRGAPAGTPTQTDPLPSAGCMSPLRHDGAKTPWLQLHASPHPPPAAGGSQILT